MTPRPDDPLASPLTLPCGLTLAGRVCKAAMTEGLADEWSRATDGHVRLYERWSRGNGAGHLLITGNVQVDRRYVERPGNVAIEGPQDPERLARLAAWAQAAQRDGTRCIVQLSHAGRQSSFLVNKKAVAPSAVKAEMLGMPLPEPRALTVLEIDDVVERFAHAASVCESVGFAGVQIHSAHGYLLSSFLTPKANLRTDQYGGSIENRARALLSVVRAVRARVSPSFAVSVKLNSADFQKGGMTPDEAAAVAGWLDDAGVDLIEVSGGSYENPAMMFGPEGFDEYKSVAAIGKANTTELREGYFLLFAPLVRRAVKRARVMVTGGFRSRAAMERALAGNELDMIGVGRPVCGDPDAVGKLLRRERDALPRFERELDLPWYARWLRFVVVGKLLFVGAFQMWTYDAFVRMGRGLEPEIEGVDLLRVLARQDAFESRTAAKLKGLDSIVGGVLNAPRSPWYTRPWFGALVLGALALGLGWRGRAGPKRIA